MRPAPKPLRGITVPTAFKLALALLLVLVVGGVLLVQAMMGRTSTVTDHLLDELMPAHVEAARLQASLLDQETGIRGYVLTGDKRFLEPYETGREGEQAALAELRRLLKDEPVLTGDLDRVSGAADTWRTQYAEPAIAHVQDGPVGDPYTAVGKTTFDALRTTWTTQNEHLDEARKDARKQLAHTRTFRDGILISVLVVLLVVSVLLALLLHLTVVRPLNALRTASRAVADGEFSRPIPAKGPVDVQDVAAAVEAMRTRILAELDAATDRERLLLRQAGELDAQAVELRRSNAELEQFAYVASHDLQEPLRKVASFCQMLERRYHDQLDDRGRQYIGFATDGAKRMQILINDLLTFSRVGRMNSHRRRVSLDETLDRALANLSERIEETSARVERPERMPELTGDPTLLSMLWQNLIGNAIKFRAPETPPLVRIECAETGPGAWEFTVTDNGIGIPAEYAEKVFVIFQRLHSREAYEGTGIGLALCKKIVEYHDGRVWLDTAHTAGTRLCFTLTEAPEPPVLAAVGAERTEEIEA